MVCANANPGNPTVNAVGSGLVAAAAYADDGVILIPTDLAHTVAASEFASSVRIASVRALINQYAARAGDRHSFALAASAWTAHPSPAVATRAGLFVSCDLGLLSLLP